MCAEEKAIEIISQEKNCTDTEAKDLYEKILFELHSQASLTMKAVTDEAEAVLSRLGFQCEGQPT